LKIAKEKADALSGGGFFEEFLALGGVAEKCVGDDIAEDIGVIDLSEVTFQVLGDNAEVGADF